MLECNAGAVQLPSLRVRFNCIFGRERCPTFGTPPKLVAFELET